MRHAACVHEGDRQGLSPTPAASACFRLDTPNRAQASPADLAVAVRIMRAFSDRVLFGFARILYLRRNPLQDGKTLQSGNSNVIDRT